MYLTKILLIGVISCMLSGCMVGEKRVKLFKLEEPRQPLNLPDPTPLTLEDIRWIIITSDNADEVFKKLEAAGVDPVIFGLTDKDYELLAKNFAQIRQKLQETKLWKRLMRSFHYTILKSIKVTLQNNILKI